MHPPLQQKRIFFSTTSSFSYQLTTLPIIAGILLGCGLAGNLMNTFYFGPASTRVMWTCQAYEKSANNGHQVGVMKFDMSALEPKQIEKYNKVRGKFGALHGISVLLNLGVIVAHTFYFYLLAKQLAGVMPVTIDAELS